MHLSVVLLGSLANSPWEVVRLNCFTVVNIL